MIDPPGIDVARVKFRILDLPGISGASPWYAACSGGLDSTVLLHLLHRIVRDTGIRVVVLHADHGLHECSAAWRRHCEAMCGEWGIEMRSTRLDLDRREGLGPEGAARAARYRWFREAAGEDAWLFTAHHQRDQAETVIERLTRGAGPRGLRGMLPLTRMQGMHLARPLLNTPYAAIRAYADHHGLTWISDDSNLDPRFTRNYVRGRVLPVLAERWPGIEAALGRTAGVMADAQCVLDETADADLRRCDARPVRGDPSVDLPALLAVSPARRRNALRYWVHRETRASLGPERLARVEEAVVRYPAPAGGLCWPPVDLRLFRDRLYLVRQREAPGGVTDWDLDRPLRPAPHIELRCSAATGRGLRRDTAARRVQVAFRRGGEKCRLPGRRHRHTLQQVLQEAGVPPWQRHRIPLVLVDGDIAAIPGVTCCEPWAAAPGEPGIDIDVIFT
ncbi:MAG: tRNA lysidine(34) synthetase TilS [Gammaproteobacteria bacterium]|nr:tRNA lysidine(34) synthetase TilS [Gammaproteobacteria bacterium]